jgi:diguanylate cyclase (GGDEF)-like protein
VANFITTSGDRFLSGQGGAVVTKKDNLLGKTLIVTAMLLAVVFAAVIFITIQNAQNQEAILEDSVKSELVATSIAARDIIDPDAFAAYNSLDDVAAEHAAYTATLERLRVLKGEVNAQYIYALKKIDGAYVFIFDTDEEDTTIFSEYELSAVHKRAFAGETSADVLNVKDEWGSFNTGAVPIIKDGVVIGIVSTDIEDTYLAESKAAARTSATILIVTMLITMSILFLALFILLRRIHAMQEHLKQIANFDAVTGLPNRQYLFSFLAEAETDEAREPFAVLFIDLDNFKAVNDGAGHDVGDDLLRSIALYLNSGKAGAATHSTGSLSRISARIGGDEFVQIMPGVKNAEDAAAVAQQLLDGFAQQPVLQPFIRDFSIGLSVGVALYPHDSTDRTELIKFADIAMYHSKSAGKNGYTLYNESMSEKAEDMPLTVHAADRG